MPAFMSAIPFVVFLIVSLLDAIIVIPGYALTFDRNLQIFMNSRRADAGAPALVDVPGSGEKAPTEAE